MSWTDAGLAAVLSDNVSSGRFLVTTVLIDILVLAVGYSNALPFEVPDIVVVFGLFVVSPVVAYLVSRTEEETE